MDTSMIRKVERKQFVISLVGVLIPFAIVTAVSISLWNSFDSNIAQPTLVGTIASSLSSTAFPVLYHVLKDLNLLNSEMGRFAMSTSMISDALGWNAVVLFEAAKWGSVSKWDALCHGYGSHGVDENEDYVKRQTRFVSREPAKSVTSTIEAVAESMGFSVHMSNYKMRLEGLPANKAGQLAVVLEVFEVAPSLFMVDVRKAAGDTLEYHRFYKKFCSKLEHIIWKPVEGAAKSGLLRTVTC